MSSGSRFAGIFLALCLFSGPTFAESADPDLPKPDAKRHWHVITQDDATTTSKCLGSRESPICAVETARACSLRAKIYLCRQAWGPDAGLPPSSHSDEWEKYQILSSGYFKEGDPRRDERNDELRWVPGDVWIVLDIRACDKFNCSKPHPKAWRYLLDRYIIHKGPDGWMVVQSGPLHFTQLEIR